MPTPPRFWSIAPLLLAGIASSVAAPAQESQPPGNTAPAASDTTLDGRPIVDLGTAETIVVTASRYEQPIGRAPSAMTVIPQQVLEQSPADDFGDLMRNVPGVNVAQAGARDFQITTRTATGMLATGQQLLMDNRSVLQDFNGFVQWDIIPVDPKEIRQIEVVRGSGGAVWGANATQGVVNIITKAPRDMPGTAVTLAGGEFGTRYGFVTHTGVQGKFGYKAMAGYYKQEAYGRPSGIIPGTAGGGYPGTPYPDYPAIGGERPQFSLRFDYDPDDETTWSASAGYAGVGGGGLSPGGPVKFDDTSHFSYVKGDWSRRAARITLYSNLTSGNSIFTTTFLPDGSSIKVPWDNKTIHLEYTDSRTVGTRQLLSFGANVRRNIFDILLAPEAPDRDEFGVYIQNDVQLTEMLRAVLGVRWDNIDPMGNAFSPRISVLASPVPAHTFRASFNQAFRSPTAVQNYMELAGFTDIPLPGPEGPILFPLLAVIQGNPDLSEEKVNSFEVGWTGTLRDKTTLQISVYRDELENFIRAVPATFYTSANPPPNWPGPTDILDIPPPDGLAGVLPATVQYVNVGETVNQGVELSVEVRPARHWQVSASYSWQDERQVTGIEKFPRPNGTSVFPISIAPAHRANGGVAYSGRRFYGNVNVNYQDVTPLWTDFNDPIFWGASPDFVMVNFGTGVYLRGESAVLAVDGQNVFDEHVVQHVVGDVISRKILARLIVRF